MQSPMIIVSTGTIYIDTKLKVLLVRVEGNSNIPLDPN